jgi:hypothetical protein
MFTNMNTRIFVQWLGPIAAAIFILGWILAVGAFIVVGDETCTTTIIPLVGEIETCTDTTAVSVILLMIVGFGATLGSLLLLGLRFALATLDSIEENTRRGRD